uniref:Uncharacterized protein n=1 Tax=Arundo donax TaxID=35708 RepID=A0A0A9EMS9_ARUDO
MNNVVNLKKYCKSHYYILLTRITFNLVTLFIL